MNSMPRWATIAMATFTLFAFMVATGATARAGEVQIADSSEARAVIIVPPDWMDDAKLPAGLPGAAAQRLQERQRLYRESVNDLAHYLGKMSGTEIGIVGSLPDGDRRTAIYVGSAAEPVFGPVGISKAGLYGFRVVVDARRGIGLYGESEVGTSYAIYELLDRLGCRWFMPTELGEVVPELPTLAVPVMDEKFAPATEARSMWQGGADFQRRNRLGPHSGGHGNVVWLAYGDGSIGRFFSADELKAHPEWRSLQADGTPHSWALRTTHPGVAEHVANKIIHELETAYEPMRAVGLRPGYSITPGDGQVPTEDPLERPYDPDPRVWEGAAGRWSVTDRQMVLFNRVAERVRERFPDVAFGDQAYVNKSMPPTRHPVPSDFRVVICPIDFNRHHPMDWPDHPNEYWLRDLVEGWNKAGARIGTYWYGINLAELSAPCPFIAKWGGDLTILLENNLKEWMPETMNGWDSMMPGYYLAIRMTFHAHLTPEQILDDLWTRFYGAAAEPMGRYWMGIDQAYLDARQYAGSPFGYLRIFTPEVMAAARAEIDAATALCQTAMERRRVKLIDDSFGLFELYMKMRRDWSEGNLRHLESDYDSWRAGILDMVRRYQDPADSTYVQGRHGNPAWSDGMYSVGYRDGSRMEREYTRHGQPMVEWKWKHNPGPEGDALPWTAPDYDDSDWPTNHVVRDTWSSIGHHSTMTDAPSGRSGRMAYRTTQRLGALPAGKHAYLWIGSTDGSAKVYVNGTLMPFSQEQVALNGYCRPGKFDITGALKTGDNQITILAERHNLNELGTGGLMGPVVIYRDR